MADRLHTIDRTQVYTEVSSGALKVRRWRIRVLSGRDASRTMILERGSMHIGSGEGNDLVLRDHTVSRAHLELRLLDSGVHVRDLGSSNGTFHQGTRITDSTIQGATVFRVGKSELALEPADAEVEVDTGLERLGAMAGAAPAMRELFGKVLQIGPADVGVLIQGETGTGKELLAHEIHDHSSRQEAPFVVVDCGALPDGLVESELFGHVRGAFTGAVAARAGAFEAADGGTIFLDEIGELPPLMQPKLLRALDQRQIKRVGENRVRNVDVRVLSATSRDLTRAVASGSFRPDLFYRLAVVRLRLPPLRERAGDIPLLVQAMTRDICGRDLVISRATVEELAAHQWPGNVRELRNVLSHALALRPDSTILELPETLGIEAQLTDGGGAAALEAGDYRAAKRRAVDRFEVQYLETLLSSHDWNISGAAREAGVDRNYLYRLMRRHGIERP